MAGEPVVDVHCHVFNADDLPVRGFVQRLHLSTPVLGPMLSILVDRVVQGRAPGYRQDMAKIRRLLATAGEADVAREVLGPENVVSPGGIEAGLELETEVDLALADLMADDPVFVRRLTAALEAETGPPTSIGAETAEGWFDRLDTTRRVWRHPLCSHSEAFLPQKTGTQSARTDEVLAR